MMEDSGHCAAAVLSFTDALGLYAFDDALGPLTDAFDVTVDSVSERAWPELAEWTTPELVQVATVSDEKETKKPEATVVRHPQRRHTRVKRTRARPEPPTPKPRKRAKTEILILQSQVAELQAQLSQLQDAAREPTAEKITESPAATQSDSRSLAFKAPEWSQLATIELQKLKEAQALNASLKAALAKESHVREAFQTELQEMNKIQVSEHNSHTQTVKAASTLTSADHSCY